jgi:hypothetical protein
LVWLSYDAENFNHNDSELPQISPSTANRPSLIMSACLPYCPQWYFRVSFFLFVLLGCLLVGPDSFPIALTAVIPIAIFPEVLEEEGTSSGRINVVLSSTSINLDSNLTLTGDAKS